MLKKAFVMAAAVAVMSPAAFAQSPTAEWAAHAQNQYQVAANITYLTASGYESKLDVYRRRDVQTPQPTLVFYHGGGWVAGTKEAAMMSLIPWLEMGWNVVNVEYRMNRVALAPAAAEDALCALRFVVNNAKTYGIDTGRIVVSGESAGGHLALMAGMATVESGLTNICSGGGFQGYENSVPKVAAIINWYGITDLTDMVTGGAKRSYAVQWVGGDHARDAVAKLVSPMTYVRAGLPPILSIQGDADPIVPYAQNVKLHEALTKAGVTNELFTIPAGGHGNFKPDERSKIFAKIREFLGKNKVTTTTN
ncbi:MAG: alpha/beta hydrolase fold domain-containing protein [Vicinamibacterales bacterium]